MESKHGSEGKKNEEESAEQSSNSLCMVTRLPKDSSKEDIEQVFQEFGEIGDIHLVNSKQCAYLQFKVLFRFEIGSISRGSRLN
jgi:RNA recognition motif-containing protein